MGRKRTPLLLTSASRPQLALLRRLLRRRRAARACVTRPTASRALSLSPCSARRKHTTRVLAAGWLRRPAPARAMRAGGCRAQRKAGLRARCAVVFASPVASALSSRLLCVACSAPAASGGKESTCSKSPLRKSSRLMSASLLRGFAFPGVLIRPIYNRCGEKVESVCVSVICNLQAAARTGSRPKRRLSNASARRVDFSESRPVSRVRARPGGRSARIARLDSTPSGSS